MEADFLLCKQDIKLTQLNEVRFENETYKRELVRLRQLIENEMRNRSHVTSAVSNKSFEQSNNAAEVTKLKENYAKLRKANIE